MPLHTNDFFTVNIITVMKCTHSYDNHIYKLVEKQPAVLSYSTLSSIKKHNSTHYNRNIYMSATCAL